MKRSADPCYRTPSAPQNSEFWGKLLGARTRLWRTGMFSSHSGDGPPTFNCRFLSPVVAEHVLTFGSAKTDLVWFRRGFEEGTFERQSRQFSLVKVLCLRGESCLHNSRFYKHKGPCFKLLLKLDRISSCTPETFSNADNMHMAMAHRGYSPRHKHCGCQH